MGDPPVLYAEVNTVLNPLEELESLEKLVAEELDLMSDAEKEIELLQRRLSQLRVERDKVRQRNNENRRRVSSLQRAAELYKSEKILDDKIKVVQSELYDLVNKVDWPLPPKKHQLTGAAKLAVAERGICTDKRGLGKTLTAFLWRRMVKSRKTLIMTTNKLINQMEKELRYWDNHHTVVNLAGFNKVDREAIYPIIAMSSDVIVLLNYESWRRDKQVINHLLSVGFDAAIFDEIHNAKESRAVLSKGLERLAPAIPRLIEMTGTLILNRPQEAWFPLYLLYPKLFPDKPSFLRDYCLNYGGNDWRWAPGGEEELSRKLQSFLVQRDRNSAGVEVPPPAIIEYPLTFDDHPEQRKAYELVTERAMAILSSGKKFSLPSILAILTRSRQMAAWPAGIRFTEECVCEDIDMCFCNPQTFKFDVYESVKIDFTFDLVKELVDEGERVIVFSNFKEPVFELQRRLSGNGLSVATLTGQTTKYQANRIENDFDLKTAPDKPVYQVLLATYKTVGEGLNLNAARHAILLDREWNPGREDQAIGRIDRMNSTDQATIHMPEVEKSVDKFMRELIERKRDIIGGFNEAVSLQTAIVEAIQNGEM